MTNKRRKLLSLVARGGSIKRLPPLIDNCLHYLIYYDVNDKTYKCIYTNDYFCFTYNPQTATIVAYTDNYTRHINERSIYAPFDRWGGSTIPIPYTSYVIGGNNYGVFFHSISGPSSIDNIIYSTDDIYDTRLNSKNTILYHADTVLFEYKKYELEKVSIISIPELPVQPTHFAIYWSPEKNMYRCVYTNESVYFAVWSSQKYLQVWTQSSGSNVYVIELSPPYTTWSTPIKSSSSTGTSSFGTYTFNIGWFDIEKMIYSTDNIYNADDHAPINILYNADEQTFEQKKDSFPEQIISWEFVNGELHIIHKKAMVDYDPNYPSTIPWYPYRTQITSIRIDEGITRIGKGAFWELPNVVNVSIPSTIQSIGIYAFVRCQKIESLTLPEGLETISTGAFYEMRIKNITFPSTVRTLGSYIFYKVLYLNSVTMNEGLTSVPAQTFIWCSDLKSVIIPSTVKQIDSYAFKGCTGGLHCYMYPTTPPICNNTAFQNVSAATVTIHVPAESLADYQTASVWSSFTANMVGDL